MTAVCPLSVPIAPELMLPLIPLSQPIPKSTAHFRWGDDWARAGTAEPTRANSNTLRTTPVRMITVPPPVVTGEQSECRAKVRAVRARRGHQECESSEDLDGLSDGSWQGEYHFARGDPDQC